MQTYRQAKGRTRGVITMLKLLKYLPLVSMFQDVSDAYKSETGKERPAYLSRRFVGAVIILLGAAATLYFGVEIDKDIIASLTENIEKMISAGIALYGTVLLIIGLFKKNKKDEQKTQ